MSASGTDTLVFEDINRRVQQYLQNPFLEKCEIAPQASRFHFDVGSAVLSAAGVSGRVAENVLAAVLLLQEGLSIHDRIDQQSGRRRQLYVLTGDFSSSRYYSILARLAEGPLLYRLCDGVVRINEAKMQVLELPLDASAEAQINLYTTVEGELLYALSDHYLKAGDLWRSQVESLVRAYVVKEVPSLAQMNSLSSRQRYAWFKDTLDRLLKLEKNSTLAPISKLFVDYFQSIQHNFDSYATLAERRNS